MPTSSRRTDHADATPSALVTGAASGIGRATALRLSDDGYQICLVDRDARGLRAISGELPESTRYCADVSDPTQCEEVLATLQQRGTVPDVLVTAAGVSCIGDVVTGDVAAWQRTLNVNTLGVMYSVRAALPRMARRQRGTIVVIASASGRITYTGEPVYVASKHAVVAFCDCLRKELAGTGVRLTVVEPGLVDTPMSRAHPLIDSVLSTVTPLQPDDIADVVSFVVGQPPRLNINEIVIRPANQEL